MSSGELFFIAVYSLFAFGAAVVVILAFAGGLHFEPYLRKVAAAMLPVLAVVGVTASTLLSGRNASLYGLTGSLSEGGGNSATVWVLRLITATAVGSATLLVVSNLVRWAPVKTAARPLFLAFALYFFAGYVASAVLGTDFSLSHKTFYPLLIVLALYMTSDLPPGLLLRTVRELLLVILVVGLLMIVVKPAMVLQDGYRGFIPGLHYRYWGLASHANNVGPLAIFFLLIVGLAPYKRRWLVGLATVVALTTLVLSQSKTAILAAALIGVLLVFRKWLSTVADKSFKPAGNLIAVALAMVAFAGLFGVIIYIANSPSDPFSVLADRIRHGGTLFTGREHIWNITFSEWRRSPIFGYGPNIWGDEFSYQHGYAGIATNAHNQFIDTLGGAGLFGVLGLVVYMLMLARYALLLAPQTRWISVAMFLFFVMRSLTEVPLKVVNITTSDFFMHAVMLAIFMRAAQQLPARPSSVFRPVLRSAYSA